MTDKKDETVKEFIVRLAEADKSGETDSRYMQSLLRKLGFVQARVVIGIVYLEGRGTISGAPISIHMEHGSIAGHSFDNIADKVGL